MVRQVPRLMKWNNIIGSKCPENVSRFVKLLTTLLVCNVKRMQLGDSRLIPCSIVITPWHSSQMVEPDEVSGEFITTLGMLTGDCLSVQKHVAYAHCICPTTKARVRNARRYRNLFFIVQVNDMYSS